tara:strand:+ start:291 stop:611 length:321 start_codon:yes stop_codon:yes gene_type:complete
VYKIVHKDNLLGENNMSKIPLVSIKVVEVLKRDLEKSSDLQGITHLVEFWREFKIDQPALATLLLEELKTVDDPRVKGYLAHGMYLVYNALKTQLEIDEMNEVWGQ